MKALVKSFDNLPKLVKIILALPCLAVAWAIYRIARSVNKKNTLGIVLGIIMIVVNAALFWVVDIITIILFNKVLWID